MKKPHWKIDDSLIISRLQQKELFHIKPALALSSQFFPLVTKVSLRPFFDNLPVKIGLDLQIIGSKIIKSQVDRGYFHHGLESHLSGLSPHQAIAAIGRLQKTAPIFYQLALMQALEELFDWPVDVVRAKRYAIALEFARVSHHLAVIKNVLYCANLDSIAELVKTCEHLLEKPCQLFSRIYLAKDLDLSSITFEEIDSALDEALPIAEEMATAINLEDALTKNLSKKAVVTLPMAGSMGLTGSYLRANRHYYDLRQNASKRVFYQTIPKICLTEGGDAYARFSLRLLEIEAGLSWLKKTLLAQQPELIEFRPIAIDDNYCSNKPAQKFAFGEIEGPEGDIKVSVFVGSTDNSLIFRVRTPAYFIAQSIPYLLSETYLRDIATVLYSIGITAEEIDK